MTTSISQSVHSAVLRAHGNLYNCVVLLKTAKSVELLLREVSVEIGQQIHLSCGKWKCDAIVTEVTPTGEVSIVRCDLA